MKVRTSVKAGNNVNQILERRSQDTLKRSTNMKVKTSIRAGNNVNQILERRSQDTL